MHARGPGPNRRFRDLAVRDGKAATRAVCRRPAPCGEVMDGPASDGSPGDWGSAERRCRKHLRRWSRNRDRKPALRYRLLS